MLKVVGICRNCVFALETQRKKFANINGMLKVKYVLVGRWYSWHTSGLKNVTLAAKTCLFIHHDRGQETSIHQCWARIYVG